MPKGSMKNLRPFKKGQSGNPQGARLHDPVVKAIRRLTNDQIAEIGTLILDNNIEAINALATDKTTSVLKAMMASVAAKCIKKGDHQALNVLLDRIAGKVKHSVEVGGIPGGTPIMTAELSDEERIKLIKKLDKQLKLMDEE